MQEAFEEIIGCWAIAGPMLAIYQNAYCMLEICMTFHMPIL